MKEWTILHSSDRGVGDVAGLMIEIVLMVFFKKSMC